MNKKKEAEYQAQIQNLESIIQKLHRAKLQWDEKEKKLEEERNLLNQNYATLQAVSEKRNSELQSQIDELRSLLLKQQDGNEIRNRKKPKPTSNESSTQPPPSPSTTHTEQMVVDTNLPTDTTTESNTVPTVPSINKPIRPPPIFVYGVKDYPTFSEFLKNNGVEKCLRKETKNNLILSPATADEYRQLHAVLRKECADQTHKETFGELQLHSYQLKSDRAFVVYIRGLPSTMSTSEIEEELKNLGYSPRRVTNVPRKVDGILKPLPLFRLELEPNIKNPEIYNQQSLLQVRIKVESFKPRNDPPLCRNCLHYGHTKHYCLRAPRCIKCGEGHASDKCTLQRTAPCKCANCGGQHPASYRGCPTFQKLRQPQHKATDEIRRRETQLPNPPQPTSTLPHQNVQQHTSYATAAKQPKQQPAIPSLPEPMLALKRLSEQIEQLASRLSSLEEILSADNWQHVRSPRSRNG